LYFSLSRQGGIRPLCDLSSSQQTHYRSSFMKDKTFAQFVVAPLSQKSLPAAGRRARPPEADCAPNFWELFDFRSKS
jgi:hypothetical protein